MLIEDIVALTQASPWAGQPWARAALADLEDRLRAVVDRWGLRLESAHDGGVGVPVLAARTSTGTAATLKLGIDEHFAQQCRVLVAAEGHGYVRVLAHDDDRDALLMERLGEPLARTTPSPEAQSLVLGDLASRTWRLPLDLAEPAAPGAKAAGLVELLDGHGRHAALGPHEEVVSRARSLAAELERSAGTEQVLVHGDPHSLNALARGGQGEHVLIDPDGFRCEPAYDLGVVLRDHCHEIERLDLAQGPGAGSRWHEGLARRVATRHGVDPERVLAWSYVERVTTGVYLHQLGYGDEAQHWLTTARRVSLPSLG